MYTLIYSGVMVLHESTSNVFEYLLNYSLRALNISSGGYSLHCAAILEEKLD